MFSVALIVVLTRSHRKQSQAKKKKKIFFICCNELKKIELYVYISFGQVVGSWHGSLQMALGRGEEEPGQERWTGHPRAPRRIRIKKKNKRRCGEQNIYFFPLQFVHLCLYISLCPQWQTGVCLVTQLCFLFFLFSLLSFLFSLGQGKARMRYNTKNQELKQIKKKYGQRDNRLGLFVERRTKERRKEGSRMQERSSAKGMHIAPFPSSPSLSLSLSLSHSHFPSLPSRMDIYLNCVQLSIISSSAS